MITWTHRGQPRPYADHIYAGRVTAPILYKAKEDIANAMNVQQIYDIGEDHQWYEPHFTKFQLVAPTTWDFIIVIAYTG